MSKHTAGPWNWRYNPLKKDRYYIRPMGSNVNLAAVLRPSAVVKNKGEQEANATLMALAPEMLDVLRFVSSCDATFIDFRDAIERAKKLVSKTEL